MIRILTTIRRKLCNHSFKYSETFYNVRTHEIMAYGYECEKCGAWRYHQEQKFCGECGADMREATT